MESKSIILALVPVLLAGLMVHRVNARIHGQVDGPRLWMLGTAMHGLGLGLIAARDFVPDVVGVVIGDTLSAGGFYVMLIGLARFAGRRSPVRMISIMAAVMLIGFPLFTYLVPSGAARFLIFAVATIMPCLFMLPHLDAIGRRDGRSSVRLLRLTILYFSFTLAALVAGVLVFDPDMPSILASNNLVALGFLSLLVIETNLVFGFVLLTAGHNAAVLRRSAMTDYLTGLPNRRAFEEAVDTAMAAPDAADRPAALAVFDIDHFKAVNDRHGHDVGDAMLRHIAQTLNGAMREGDFVARMGGEEFVALIHADRETTVRQVAERVRRCVEATPLLIEGKAIQVTISAGVVNLNDTRRSFTDLFRRADAALYEAKDTGRNRIVLAAA